MAREPACTPDRLGFVGLGIMGSRMAANLLREGIPVTVWNRTRERAEAIAEEHGADVADTPAQAIKRDGIWSFSSKRSRGIRATGS